jgi:alcohol dehydrogenase
MGSKRSPVSGLCYTDVHITEGRLPTGAFPRTKGHEPASEIAEVGEGVTSRKIGDRVGVRWTQVSCGRCEWCQRGKPMFCVQQIATEINTPGSHADYMLLFLMRRLFFQMEYHMSRQLLYFALVTPFGVV